MGWGVPHLLHNNQHLTRANRVIHRNRHPNHLPGLWRLQLILHLHRLNHHQSLLLDHLIPSTHQHPTHPPRHRSLHRLRPDTTSPNPTPPAQRPRILHLKLKPLLPNQNSIPIQHTPVLPSLHHQRHHSSLQYPHIHRDSLPIDDTLQSPVGSTCRNLHPTLLPADLEPNRHWRNPSCRPAKPHRLSGEALPPPGAASRSKAANKAAARAATSSGTSAPSTIDPAASNRSRYPVSIRATRKSASIKIRRNRERFVLIPPITYSPSALSIRSIATSLVSPNATSFDSIGSYSSGTTHPGYTAQSSLIPGPPGCTSRVINPGDGKKLFSGSSA